MKAPSCKISKLIINMDWFQALNLLQMRDPEEGDNLLHIRDLVKGDNFKHVTLWRLYNTVTCNLNLDLNF